MSHLSPAFARLTNLFDELIIWEQHPDKICAALLRDLGLHLFSIEYAQHSQLEYRPELAEVC